LYCKNTKFKVKLSPNVNANGADYVHEDMDARHEPGKRAKYLESVVREKKKEIFDIVVGKL
jgi:hypothetical protein